MYEIAYNRNKHDKDEYHEIEQGYGCKCCPLTTYIHSIYSDLMSHQYDLTLLGCSMYISTDIIHTNSVPVRMYVQIKCMH